MSVNTCQKSINVRSKSADSVYWRSFLTYGSWLGRVHHSEGMDLGWIPIFFTYYSYKHRMIPELKVGWIKEWTTIHLLTSRMRYWNWWLWKYCARWFRLYTTPFVTIMMDETTDASNTEQVVICLCWVDGNLEAHEEFTWFYKVACTESSDPSMVVQDVLARMNVAFNHLRGQCYAGTSLMSVSRSGVVKCVQKEEPRVVYMHCYGYALNVACSDSVKGCQLMKDALDIVYEITKLIKKSPRHDSTFQALEEISPTSPGIQILWWTVRADALHSIVANYAVL